MWDLIVSVPAHCLSFYFLFQMLNSNVQLVNVLTRGGGKLSRAVYLAPRPEFQRERIIHIFYYTIYYRNISLKGI